MQSSKAAKILPTEISILQFLSKVALRFYSWLKFEVQSFDLKKSRKTFLVSTKKIIDLASREVILFMGKSR